MKLFIFTIILLSLTFVSQGARAAQWGVPFTSQAPFFDWSEPYQNFCEEAAIVMAAHYVWGVPITPRIADIQMRIIQAYEDIVYKRNKDTSAQEIADTLKVLYGFRDIAVIKIDSVPDLTRELKSGRIMIAPIAGKMLGNPYYTPPGPLYHTIVIKGYDNVSQSFVVNDPGTWRGSGLLFDENILFGALHDWNGGDVMNGEKVVVSIGKQ